MTGSSTAIGTRMMDLQRISQTTRLANDKLRRVQRYMQEFSAGSYCSTTFESAVSFSTTGTTLETGPLIPCLFWHRPGFYCRKILERRFSTVATSRATATYCLEPIISSFFSPMVLGVLSGSMDVD